MKRALKKSRLHRHTAIASLMPLLQLMRGGCGSHCLVDAFTSNAIVQKNPLSLGPNSPAAVVSLRLPTQFPALEAFWFRGDSDKSGNDDDNRDSLSKAAAAPKKRKERRNKRRRRRGGGGSQGAVGATGAESPSARYYAATVSLDMPSSNYIEVLNENLIRSSRAISLPAPDIEEDQPGSGLARRIIENAAESFLFRKTIHSLNLQVCADGDPQLFPLLGKGEVGSFHATFDRLAFPALAVSGGGRIGVTGMRVNPLSFLPVNGRKTPMPSDASNSTTILANDMVSTKPMIRRYTSPFQIHATNCILTQDDVRTARCIRNGLRILLNRILKRTMKNLAFEASLLGPTTVEVQGVDILSTGKLSCTGVAITESGARIPFEVRTGIAVSSHGHVLKFPGIEMVLNPGTPLLEVVLPLHRWQRVDVDIGNDAVIEAISIDGKRKRITISLSATVVRTPSVRPAGLTSYKQRSDAFSAKYSCDMGEWLTNLWKLKEA